MNDRKMLCHTTANVNTNRVPFNEERTKSMKNHIAANQLKLNDKGLSVDLRQNRTTDEPLPDVKPSHHLKIYQSIMDYHKLIISFFGFTCRYDWNRYRYCLFWSTNFFLMLGNFCIGFTAYVYYQQGDMIRILEPCAVSGLAITCVLKWKVSLTHVNRMLALMFGVRKICEETKTGNRADAITASLKETQSLLRVFAAAIVAVLIFFVSVPLKFFFVDHIYYPLLPMLIPFCDPDTLKGYLWTSFFQLTLGVYSAVAGLVFGTAFIIVICNYGLLVNLIELDFKDLDDMWSPSSETSIAERHAFLNNIAVKLEDIRRYMREAKTMYETKFFVFFLVSYVGQVLSLYQITEKDWLPGYMTLSVVFIEMMFYCMVGTQTITSGDKLCTFIHRANWYTYDIHSQKKVRFMLEQCQQPCSISLYCLGTLDVETGIRVVKGIYSYYTVMTELL